MVKDYKIARASGTCAGCGKELAGGQRFVAVLYDRGEGFERHDYCLACWEARGESAGAGAFCLWRGRVPVPEEPGRRLVSDEVLIDFFEKLDGRAEPTKVSLRFVVALMLMRKRLLVYDSSEVDEQGREVWTMHFKSDSTPVRVIHPQLDADQMAEVARQLGSLFEVDS
ncbi:MAG: hypothetical protein B1H04_01030 [Planctomycetales bacterium 4484_123]|nr:MAG: hypothetical protein B1H04_01030 [Planctomycetales bacterium 4484_123]